MEKYRISVTEYTLSILMKDMVSFGFLKADGQPNKNAFLNRLIANFLDDYLAQSNEQLGQVETLLKKYVDMEASERTHLSDELLKSMRENYFFRLVDERSVILSIKPTKESEEAFSVALHALAGEQSISSFFRGLFDAYVNMPQNMRERILFKVQFEKLVASIEKERKVLFTFVNKPTEGMAGSLYFIGNSDEEMFNYCLFQCDDKLRTARLSRIKSVRLLNEPASFDEDKVPLLEFQKNHSLPHPVTKKDFDVVKVRLNEEGKTLFRKIYLYRPTPFRIEGNDYYFLGNHDSIMRYFERFGRTAIILEPEYLRMKMENYYRDSFYVYQRAGKSLKSK